MPPATLTRAPLVPSLAADDCRLFVDSIIDYAVFMLDPEGRVTTWNRGAERIKGYSPAEIVGEHFSRFYTDEDRSAGKPERMLALARESGHAEDEGWRVRKDGSLFWANAVITALRDPSGKLRGFGKVTRDLTLKRAHEEQLRRSEERFHRVIDAVTDYAIFMLDDGGYVQTWNAGAERAKGYKAAEIIGKHFSTFYTPEERERRKPGRILERARKDGRAEDEGWRVRKDGSLFWANVVITPLFDDNGEPLGFAKVTRDLTSRRAAEEQLRQSEERFRLLVEGVTEYAIYMLSPAGVVQTWNRGAERMKGYAAPEIIGKHFSAFFREEDVRAGKPDSELAVALGEGRFEEEGWRVRKDGSRFWASVVLTALRDHTGTLIGFAKITRDLTAKRESEEIERTLLREQAARAAAESLAARAEEANRSKDEFLAIVSHELRTPLNAIVGWAAILRGRALEPTVTKAVEVIERNAHAQTKIIEDILDVSRIMTGKLRMEPQPIDLCQLVEQAIEVVRYSADAKQISIRFEPEASACPLVGDPERIRQVIWNLLSNAVKFTSAGGAISVVLEREPSGVKLRVTDNGIGIDPELLPLVFDRFKQGDSSTTRRFGGLGLGLALVRHIVELHGGSVFVESRGLGRGATFSITLPTSARRPSSAPPPVIEPSPLPPRAVDRTLLAGLELLVVDDDQDTNDLVATLLADAGAVVRSAFSAADALASLAELRPHIIVSDISMPGEDGYSLMRRIRKLPAEQGGKTPAIALTAYTRTEDRTRALAAGFTTHIGKPVNSEDLLAAVSNLAAGMVRSAARSSGVGKPKGGVS